MERARHPVLLYTLIWVMVLGWTFNFIIGKITLRWIDVYTLTSFRIILSGACMIPVYFAMPRRSRLKRGDLWTFFVLAIFGVVANRGLFVVGLNYTTAGHSALIVATMPVITLILARAMQLESITRTKLAGMVLSFAGTALLVGGEALHLRTGTWIGDVITLVGTTGFALYTVLAKKVAGKYDTISMNTFCNVIGAILLLPLGIHQAARLHWAEVGWVGWTGLAYMVLVSSVGAYLIFFWALRYVSASRIAVFTYIEPPLAASLGILLLGEKPTVTLLAGGALILAGVYVAEFARGAHEVPADTAGA